MLAMVGRMVMSRARRRRRHQPNYVIGMLRLGNLHLMKTILLAIGVSSLLMFAGSLAA